MSSRRKTILAFLLVPMALLLTLTSVSVASARAPHGAGSSATHPILGKPKIKISAFTFTVPRKVRPGVKVIVINNDSFKHTVTSDDGTSFNVTIPGNSKASFFAPATPGSYPFHCTIHPTMQAVLKVKQPA